MKYLAPSRSASTKPSLLPKAFFHLIRSVTMLNEILDIDNLIKWYENEENFFWLNEIVSTLIYNKDEERLKTLSKKVIVLEKVDVQKLLDWLRENEEKFYKDVMNSDTPNFLITSYYSLYLRFIKTIWEKGEPEKGEPLSNMETLTNFLVTFFAIPIVIYLRKKEVFPYTSELGGILLHVLIHKSNGRRI